MIVTANHHLGLRPDDPVRDWQDWKQRFIEPAAFRRGVRLSPRPKRMKPIVAQVNDGRWLVYCPGRSCNGAEYAWEEGEFMCVSCFNADADHCYLPSTFPKERLAIEGILDARPLTNRHWWAHESLADLEIENIEHGIPLPVEV